MIVLDLSEKLKEFRKRNRLDQFKMAELVGVSHRTYQDIEKTGKVKKAKDLKAINDILEGDTQKGAQFQDEEIDAEKEDLKKLVTAVATAKGVSQENLATEMGYGKNYISEMLSPSGKPTDKFVNSFRLKYSDYLGNPNSQENNPKENIAESEGKDLQNVKEDIEQKSDYVRLLEDNDRFFKEFLKSNLAGMEARLQKMLHSILANVEAGFQYNLELKAGGDLAKAAELKKELDIRIGEKMGQPQNKGSVANI